MIDQTQEQGATVEQDQTAQAVETVPTASTVPAAPKTIETASATTSSATNTSSPAAYVVTIGVLILLSCLLAAPARALIDAVSQVSEEDVEQFLMELDGDEVYYTDDLGLEEGPGGEGVVSDLGDLDEVGELDIDAQGSLDDDELSAEDALAYSFSFKSETIGSGVAATAYAGASQEASAYVQQVVQVDGDANEQLVSLLRMADASDDEGFSQAIAEARELCATTAEELAAIEIPNLGDEGRNMAQTAQNMAVARWDSIDRCLAELEGGGDVSLLELDELDNAVRDATNYASEDLVATLELSAS